VDRRLFKNIFGSWLGLGATVIVGFFLTPFVLHYLGDVGFGLWILTTTVTGYYGLMDLGLRSAIVRYVSKDVASGDWEGVSRTASTTFFSYSIIGLLIALITLLVVWKFDILFHVAPQWSRSGKLLLLVMGIGSAVTVPVALFGGILEGIQKFYFVGAVQTVTVLIRAGLIVLALRSGFGLVTLGFIAIASNFCSNLLYWQALRRFCPSLHLSQSNVQKSTFRMLFSFGIITFGISMAQQLRFQTDSIVIGSFLSVQLITLFAIASKLVSYSGDAVQFMAQVFTPMSSHFEARGEHKQLQRILIVGNRYASLVILPLASILLILGKSFIRVWVGPAYLSSYSVLVILTIPMTLYLAQAASTKILFGMSRHGALAIALFVEGVANLGLSILLLRWYGVNGVALGTAIPMVFTSVFFLPYYLCRLLRMEILTFLMEAYTYPVLVCFPFASVLWCANHWIHPHNYAGLCLVLLMGGSVYGACLLAYFCKKEHKISLEISSSVEPSEADPFKPESPSII